MSLLEIAWAVAAEEPRSYSLAELAMLLFDEDHALPQYVTFCMLLHDEIYFKPVSWVDMRRWSSGRYGVSFTWCSGLQWMRALVLYRLPQWHKTAEPEARGMWHPAQRGD